jgi:hypothetical protein
VSEGEDRARSSPPGWYPYGEGRQAWWDGEAFGPVAPLAPSGPPQPHFEPHKPRIGTNATILLVLLGVILMVGLMVIVDKLDPDKAEVPLAGPTANQTEVLDPTDGCARMLEFLRFLQRPGVTGDQAVARLRGLREAARAHDPELAIDLQLMLDASDTGRAREIIWMVMSRCQSVGDLTAQQLAEVGLGPATVT